MKCRCGKPMTGDGRTAVWRCPDVHFAPGCYPTPSSEPVSCHRGEAAHLAMIARRRENRSHLALERGAV